MSGKFTLCLFSINALYLLDHQSMANFKPTSPTTTHHEADSGVPPETSNSLSQITTGESDSIATLPSSGYIPTEQAASQTNTSSPTHFIPVGSGVLTYDQPHENETIAAVHENEDIIKSFQSQDLATQPDLQNPVVFNVGSAPNFPSVRESELALEVEEKNRSIQDLKGSLAEKEVAERQLTEELEETINKKELVEKELEDTKLKFEEIVKTKDEEISRLKQEIEAKEREVEQGKTRLSNAERINDKKRQEYQAEIDKLKKEIKEKEEQRKNEVHDRDLEIMKLQLKVSKMETVEQNLKREIEQSKREKAEIDAKLAKERQKRAEEQQKRVEEKAENDSKQALERHRKLEKKVTDQQFEIERLRSISSESSTNSVND